MTVRGQDKSVGETLATILYYRIRYLCAKIRGWNSRLSILGPSELSMLGGGGPVGYYS